MSNTSIDSIVLALLFASDEPLSPRRIASLLDDVSTADIGSAVDRIEKSLRENLSSVRLERVAGGLQLATNPEYAEYIARMYKGRRKQRLSRAAMESMAIIAYKQPITRADVENLRGVGCGGVITTLMERSLIKMVGKAKVLGAPFLYGTTPEFLEYLGLNSLKDLPSMEELETLLEREEDAGASQSQVEETAHEVETDENGEAHETREAGGGAKDGDADERDAPPGALG